MLSPAAAENKTMIIVSIIVGLLIICLVVVIILICCFRRKKKNFCCSTCCRKSESADLDGGSKEEMMRLAADCSEMEPSAPLAQSNHYVDASRQSSQEKRLINGDRYKEELVDKTNDNPYYSAHEPDSNHPMNNKTEIYEPVSNDDQYHASGLLNPTEEFIYKTPSKSSSQLRPDDIENGEAIYKTPSNASSQLRPEDSENGEAIYKTPSNASSQPRPEDSENGEAIYKTPSNASSQLRPDDSENGEAIYKTPSKPSSEESLEEEHEYQIPNNKRAYSVPTPNGYKTPKPTIASKDRVNKILNNNNNNTKAKTLPPAIAKKPVLHGSPGSTLKIKQPPNKMDDHDDSYATYTNVDESEIYKTPSNVPKFKAPHAKPVYKKPSSLKQVDDSVNDDVYEPLETSGNNNNSFLRLTKT